MLTWEGAGLLQFDLIVKCRDVSEKGAHNELPCCSATIMNLDFRFTPTVSVPVWDTLQ